MEARVIATGCTTGGEQKISICTWENRLGWENWGQSLINEIVAVQDGAVTRAFEVDKDELLLPRRRITVWLLAMKLLAELAGGKKCQVAISL